MSQYLMPLVSLLGMAPSPFIQVRGIPYGQRSVPLTGRSLHASYIYILGGTLCVPVGSALWAPVPQITASMRPRCPDLEEDISGSHLRHGVQLATLQPC